MVIDPSRVTAILEEAGRTEVLPRFQALAEEDVRRKASGELVTVADEAAEAFIAKRLTDLLPGSQIVGEESVAADPRRMDLLKGRDFVWVIDPIDGTGNFAAGRPLFAVMVALVRDNDILGGWIHDPVSGETVHALKGEGCYSGSQRLSMRRNVPFQDLQGTLHAGRFSSPSMFEHINARRGLLRTQDTLSSAGQEYLRMAKGDSDFSLFTKLMPWDHVPGAILLREAGGLARTLDGQNYRPLGIYGPALLLAPDQAAWQALFDCLFDGVALEKLESWQGNDLS